MLVNPVPILDRRTCYRESGGARERGDRIGGMEGKLYDSLEATVNR